MQENHEVFLGQKESVARYNLDAKETVWSTKIKGTPHPKTIEVNLNE
jgi:hypothetical protein